MPDYDRRRLFDFMLARINDVGLESGLRTPQAFGKWFANTTFPTRRSSLSDGGGDGKVDSFFQTNDGTEVQHHVLNTKFTGNYDALAPVAFDDEITRFWQAFANKSNRRTYVANAVRSELRTRYQKLFTHYDDGRASAFLLERITDAMTSSTSRSRASACGCSLETRCRPWSTDIEDATPRTPTPQPHGNKHRPFGL